MLNGHALSHTEAESLVSDKTGLCDTLVLLEGLNDQSGDAISSFVIYVVTDAHCDDLNDAAEHLLNHGGFTISRLLDCRLKLA